jgi:hypothetical protein
LKETYAPVLLARKAARLQKEHGNTIKTKDAKRTAGVADNALILHSIVRPAKMFLFSPIVTSMCIYVAVAYGLLYILFT